MKKTTNLCFAILFLLGISCKNETKNQQVDTSKTEIETPFFKLSLAQWSLHKYVNDEKKSPFHFASQAKTLGFDGLEYVTQLYDNEIETMGFDAVIDTLSMLSKKHNIANVLIMVDHEGDLADPDDAKRDLAVENHKKWVDAAQKLGCHAIRVNTFGTNDPEVWKTTVVDGLKKLSLYAATKNINVLCENHGWLSSDADKLMLAIDEVNMENCGTLPDFGNWCVKRKDGERWGECVEEYPDKYKGIKLMMPKAKAVSAKSYAFDANGNETTIDYAKMLQLVKNADYTGYIGVEFEGKEEGVTEIEGIKATRDLLLSSAKKLN